MRCVKVCLQCPRSTGLTIADWIQWGHSLMVDPMYVLASPSETLTFADLLVQGDCAC